MTFLRHLTALSGVGFGGGSIVYANVLAEAPDAFFQAPSWNHLADWRKELDPHYRTALSMLGGQPYWRRTPPDEVLRELAGEMDREDALGPATVGVFQGRPGVTEPDPYFGGRGPARTGCIHCGGCMLGCRFNAKNTLDRNYLYLAESMGLQVRTETEVTGIRPVAGSPSRGYEVTALEGVGGLLARRPHRRFRAHRVVLSAGVLGTVSLLLRMRRDPDGLPDLSSLVGRYVRTNSEVLMGMVDASRDMSEGVAITSLLRLDGAASLEPVRFSPGSGFFRLLLAPHAPGETLPDRMAAMAGSVLRRPVAAMRAFLVPDLGRHGLILLYMRAAEGHIRLSLGRQGWRLRSEVGGGSPPTASIPEATRLGRRVESLTGGFLGSLLTESLFATPTTAHVLGGCVLGDGPETGVLSPDQQVWGYPGLYVMDGSAVSANPGVNPSLTITAMAERAVQAMG
jgi:cholesterol oxidase